jgi:hypothetical protein
MRLRTSLSIDDSFTGLFGKAVIREESLEGGASMIDMLEKKPAVSTVAVVLITVAYLVFAAAGGECILPFFLCEESFFEKMRFASCSLCSVVGVIGD